MRLRLLLPCALATTLGVATPVEAQTFASYFTRGDEVKIRADGAMRKLSISRGPYTRTQGAGRGFVRGAAIGLVLGGLAAAFPSCGTCSGEGLLDVEPVQGALAGAATGCFVGSVIGMIFPGTRWESIPVTTYHVRPSVSGRGVELGVVFRF